MNKLFSKIKKEELTSDEKARILSSLKDYAERHPVEKKYFRHPLKMPYHLLWNFVKEKKIAVPIIVLLIFVLTGSTVFGAKYSLPGQILYPVKLLNESIQTAVTVETKAKTRVSTEHALTRLKEAEMLAVQGNLTQEKTAELENKFTKHSNAVKQNIEVLKKNGDENDAKNLQVHFEDSITKQKDNIDKLSNDEKVSSSTRENLIDLTSHIEKEIKKEDANRNQRGEIKKENTGNNLERKTDVQKTDNWQEKQSQDSKPSD